METTNWHWRREYPVAPAKLDAVNEARSLWHETPGEIEDALEYGREKARLLSMGAAAYEIQVVGARAPLRRAVVFPWADVPRGG